MAATIARRSRPELGHSGLAAQQGFLSPEALIQNWTGSSKGDAYKLVAVGTMMADTEAADKLVEEALSTLSTPDARRPTPTPTLSTSRRSPRGCPGRRRLPGASPPARSRLTRPRLSGPARPDRRGSYRGEAPGGPRGAPHRGTVTECRRGLQTGPPDARPARSGRHRRPREAGPRRPLPEGLPAEQWQRAPERALRPRRRRVRALHLRLHHQPPPRRSTLRRPGTRRLGPKKAGRPAQHRADQHGLPRATAHNRRRSRPRPGLRRTPPGGA